MSNHPYMPQPPANDDHWSASALCGTADPDRPYLPGRSSQAEQVERCESCPVRVDCLQAALDGREKWGVWGGKTPAQRRVILAQGLTADEALADSPAQHQHAA